MTITTAERQELETSLAQLQTDVRVADQVMIEWRASMDDTQPLHWTRLYGLGAEVSRMRTRIAAITEMLATYPVEVAPVVEAFAPATVDLDQLIRGTTMTRLFFDDAIRRAMAAGLEVFESVDGNPETVNVRSQSLGTLHTVTRTRCSCSGFANWAHCLHVALFIAWREAWHSDPLPNPIHAGARLTVRPIAA